MSKTISLDQRIGAALAADTDVAAIDLAALVVETENAIAAGRLLARSRSV